MKNVDSFRKPYVAAFRHDRPSPLARLQRLGKVPMGVPLYRWMVYFMENPIENGWSGGPFISGNLMHDGHDIAQFPMKWDDHKPYMMFGPRHIRYCFPIERYVVSGNFGGVPMSSSHDLCVLHFVEFASYQASDWWLKCPKASSYADSGPFTQLDRCFRDGLKYPFSFPSLQFGTAIAVDRFQGQQEGGRCVGDQHSMKDLEPWAAVGSDLLRHLVHQCSLSCAPEVDHGVTAWVNQKNSEKMSQKYPVPKVSSDSFMPHLIYWLFTGFSWWLSHVPNHH